MEDIICKSCEDVVLQKKFYSVQAWLDCIEYIKELLESGRFDLIEATCDFDNIRDKNGKWSSDNIYYVIRCKNCGQVFRCYADTYHGSGEFVNDSN